jgi:hypothetical protein
MAFVPNIPWLRQPQGSIETGSTTPGRGLILLFRAGNNY